MYEIGPMAVALTLSGKTVAHCVVMLDHTSSGMACHDDTVIDRFISNCGTDTILVHQWRQLSRFFFFCFLFNATWLPRAIGGPIASFR